MADIVVTFPKTRQNEERLKPYLDYFRKNIKGFDFFAYKIPSFPTRSLKGDKCYIGFNNKIHGYFIIKNFEKLRNEEAEKFRDWDGSGGMFVFCPFESFTELPEPKPSYEKGTRGFWYWNDAIGNRVIKQN